MNGDTLPLRQAWPLYAGMAVAGAAAVVASASTLAGLARAAGWAGWTPWLLPAALDVGGSVGGWCWLRPGAPADARAFGRAVALVGAGGTLVGNGVGHLVASGFLDSGPMLVVVVGAVPAAVLVALVHLAVLVTTPSSLLTVDQDRVAGEEDALEVVHEREPSAVLPLAPPASDEPSLTRAAVLAAISSAPATIAELVRATGRSRTTVVGHLDALAREGLAERGTKRQYRATPQQGRSDVLAVEG